MNGDFVYVVTRADYDSVVLVAAFFEKQDAELLASTCNEWAAKNRPIQEAEIEHLKPTLDRERDRFLSERDKFCDKNGWDIHNYTPEKQEAFRALREKYAPTPWPYMENPHDPGGGVDDFYSVSQVELR